MFYSFWQAYKALDIPVNPDYGISIDHNDVKINSLKIIESSYSYHKIYQRGRIVHYVGLGKLNSPGHPAVNQQWLHQEPFRLSMCNSIPIPIFIKLKLGVVEYMGSYLIKDIVKKIGFEGFTYFHVILQRI